MPRFASACKRPGLCHFRGPATRPIPPRANPGRHRQADHQRPWRHRQPGQWL